MGCASLSNKANGNLRVTWDKLDRQRTGRKTDLISVASPVIGFTLLLAFLPSQRLMIYTLFFLLGLPLWLIASARIFRSGTNRSMLKAAWTGLAFFAPLVIFSCASVANILIEQQLREPTAGVRGFGYFLVLVKFFAFFSPFVVSLLFESRYGVARSRIGRL